MIRIKIVSLASFLLLSACASAPKVNIGKQQSEALDNIAFNGNPFKVQRILRGKKKVEVEIPTYDHPSAYIVSDSRLSMPFIHFLDQGLNTLEKELDEKVKLEKAQLYHANSYETWKQNQKGTKSLIGLQYGAIGAAAGYLIASMVDYEDKELKATFLYEEDSYVCNLEGVYADQPFKIQHDTPRKLANDGLQKLIADCQQSLVTTLSEKIAAKASSENKI